MCEDLRESLRKFIEDHCLGREYDSCVNSPCKYSSSNGCKHPEHPKNKNRVKSDE
jgi:hypothetical protein